jgi:hypothetical protein
VDIEASPDEFRSIDLGAEVQELQKMAQPEAGKKKQGNSSSEVDQNL